MFTSGGGSLGWRGGAAIGASFDPPPDYAAIAAAAGGAFACIVRRPEELNDALAAALRAVNKMQRCAVVNVWLPHL